MGEQQNMFDDFSRHKLVQPKEENLFDPITISQHTDWHRKLKSRMCAEIMSLAVVFNEPFTANEMASKCVEQHEGSFENYHRCVDDLVSRTYLFARPARKCAHTGKMASTLTLKVSKTKPEK